jgi:hypothetical protein
MKTCDHCQQEVEWRYKDGWGIMACPGWFAGSCEGQPLGVIFPSSGHISPLGSDADAMANYSNWLNTRLRALWPSKPPT